MPPLLKKAMLGLSTLALAVGTTSLVAPTAQGDVETVAVYGYTASRWLDDQLEGGLVVSGYDNGGNWVEYTDFGLSLDVYYALEALQTRPAAQTAILDAIEPRLGEYVGTGATRYAGAEGKLLTAVQKAGIAPADYGDGSLLADLEGLVHTAADDEQGRAKDAFDAGDPWGGDYSNTIGQSFVVRALVDADSSLADEALSFLLKQQCDAGFFRVYMESSDFTCEAGRGQGQSGASVDATAFALLAMLEARQAGVGGLDAAIDAAVTWLLGRERAGGGFAEGGVVNANSTGLAAQVLAEVGESGAAGTAAAWLRARQVGEARAEGTALAGEVGAVAYDDDAYDTAAADGIGQGALYQWRRATAQAAVGLAALLPAAQLTAQAPDVADRGTRLKVVLSGLQPHERYTLMRRSGRVASGWANDAGRAVERVATGPRRGTLRLKVIGSRANRVGKTTVEIR